ncbi:MAG: DUF1203 domain-containing protein [Acidobacteria bacterium]|nr:DUF1203 domain-containing protein [Acidobacteriota bacterium]
MSYKVVPIPSEIARGVRETMRAPQYQHPAFADVAKGYGPCRQCLKTFVRDADERILFTYNSFENLSPLPLPGPVFIHKNECRAYDGDGFPPDLVALPLLFEGFGRDSELLIREPVEKDAIDAQLARIFASAGVRYVNIRNAEAGCFVARVDRA